MYVNLNFKKHNYVRINKIAVNCGGAETTFTGDANLFSDGTKAAVVISRNDGATGTFNINNVKKLANNTIILMTSILMFSRLFR